MEDLVFLLKLNQHLCLEMESGHSLYSGLMSFEYSRQQVQSWYEYKRWLNWFRTDQSLECKPLFSDPMVSNYFLILSEGLAGGAVLEKMISFEEEIMECLEFHLQMYVNRLPYLLMLPLMIFIFPSFLVLMLGPILSEVLKVV